MSAHETRNKFPFLQLVAPDGSPLGDTDIGLGEDELRELCRLMVLARRLDAECVSLARDGELVTYPGFEGQEAAQVGSASALGPTDFVFPTFRELAAALVRGVDPATYLRYHRGVWHGGPWDVQALRFGPICVPTGTQLPHAAGWALAAKLDGTGACALGYIGEGATSEGDFHEAANLAGVWKLPLVIFVQNNGWAITTPAKRQFAGEIVERARGYGIEGVRVDGNDVLAVRRVTDEAVARARSGGGATLVEAMTYRIGPHSTNDDATRYRSEAEVEERRALDPIARYRSFLVRAGVADESFIDSCAAQAEALAERVRAEVIALPDPDPQEMFAHVYGAPSAHFLRERDEALGTDRG